MDIKVLVYKTTDYENINECIVDINDLPNVLLELAREASEITDNQELVISFPNDDADTMSVEIYNSYRE